jgi:hypothetical protein
VKTLKIVVAISSVLITVGAAGVPRGGAASVVSTPINVTNDEWANNEESLGMDPSGTLLAGAWNDWEYNDGCGFSYSTDGGAHWAPETFVPGFTAFTNDPDIPGTGRFSVAGDPSVAFNPKFGVFDVMCQSFGSKTGNQIQLLATTFDPNKADPTADENESYGSAAWTKPVAVAAGTSNGSQKGSNGQLPDHESIFIDTVDAPGHHYGRLLVGWAEFSGLGRSPINVAFSDDNGQTWTGPIRVSDAKHKFDQDARLAIAPNGDVYMTWSNSPNEKSTKNNLINAARSTDGGLTWSRVYEVAPIVSPVAGGLPNSDYRAGSDVAPAIDLTTGKLVVAFNDAAGGASTVYETHTAVAGDLTSFTTPVAVAPTGKEQFFPWISSAPNGRLDLVYYDRFCDPGDKKNCLVLASSTDSGTSWSTVTLLGTGFDGDTFGACLAFVQEPDCGRHFIGDYIEVHSTNAKAEVLYTGNGAHALDVFSVRATF